ncbi:threonine--tRNA ligase [Candidatus Pacearchaeota archaeon]|nr:threonine--tRNA ligase [Candidatus Pacearchaeota archaeon]
MKILTLHCDFIRFKPLKKAIKNPEELSEERKKEIVVKDPLVILTAVEKGDNDKVVKEMIASVKKTAGEVKAERIVLYPYAHLSSNLSDPTTALEYLAEAENVLKKEGFEVTRAPFGYYKEFELKCKGHPLSELSKQFRAEEDSTSMKASVKEDIIDPSKLYNKISQTKLDTSKLKENDHRIIGQKLGLFMFNESSPGAPYWLPNGLIVYHELLKFWREEHSKAGYKETMTPLVNKKELYDISGHWHHYKENMFVSDMGEDGVYCLKPMNCPNAMIIFKSQTRSYKDLPLRLSDADRLHRYELSGVLNGLLRVRSFQQDDSHNFITEDMISSEYEEIFRICEKFYSIFGLDYSFRLGTRPDKFLGESKTWDKAEKNLKEILKKSGKKFTIAEGDGAFYGPKVDIIMKDSLGREWQMGTVQLDFQLPQRFGLKYVDKDGKDKIPVVIHRVIYGSLERFIGILLEHTNGSLPIWLSPVQVRVIDFTERNTKAAQKIMEEIKKAIPEIRIDSDFRNTTVNDKVRDAEMQKVPLIIVIGDKEEKSNTLALRKRGEKPEFEVKLDSFIKETKGKIENRN